MTNFKIKVKTATNFLNIIEKLRKSGYKDIPNLQMYFRKNAPFFLPYGIMVDDDAKTFTAVSLLVAKNSKSFTAFEGDEYNEDTYLDTTSSTSTNTMDNIESIYSNAFKYIIMLDDFLVNSAADDDIDYMDILVDNKYISDEYILKYEKEISDNTNNEIRLGLLMTLMESLRLLSIPQRCLLYYIIDNRYVGNIEMDDISKFLKSKKVTIQDIFNYYDAKEYVKEIKVFLSHNMSSLTDDEVKVIRDDATKEVEKLLAERERNPFRLIIIENYYHLNAPVNAGKLWHLGRSIQQLEDADYIYFVPDKSDSRGCEIERQIASIYNIQVLN